MAKKFDNTMRGALFINDKKRAGKQDPDYTGKAEVGGVEYWLSGWKNESEDGVKYLSVSFKEKEDKKGKSRNNASRGRDEDEDNSF